MRARGAGACQLPYLGRTWTLCDASPPAGSFPSRETDAATAAENACGMTRTDDDEREYRERATDGFSHSTIRRPRVFVPEGSKIYADGFRHF